MSGKRSSQSKEEQQRKWQRFIDWLGNDPIKVFSSWPVERAATLKPTSLGKTRAARAPFSRLDAFWTPAQKSPRFVEGRTAVDDIREHMQEGNNEPFFLIIRLYRFEVLRTLLQDPGIYEIVQGWEKASDRGERTATERLARVGKELARASYRSPRLPPDKRPRSGADSVSITRRVTRLLKEYQDNREAGRGPEHAYRAVLINFCNNSRVHDEDRKRLIFERFDDAIVKTAPPLRELVKQKIWQKAKRIKSEFS